MMRPKAKELFPPLPVGTETRKENAEAWKLTLGKADLGRNETQRWASVSDGRPVLEGRGATTFQLAAARNTVPST
jgi:hypothetical protein